MLIRIADRPARAIAALVLPFALASCLALTSCRKAAPTDRTRVSGHVEADDVQIAPEVGGRILELKVKEGDRLSKGDLVAQLDTRDTDLSLQRQADAQALAADADVAAATADLSNAQTDLERYESLLRANAGSQKARDDAKARSDVAEQRVNAAKERARSARETAARFRAGSRREEIDAARARLAAVDAQIATLQKALQDATVTSPVGGIVTEKLVNEGELVAPRSPLVVVTDLDDAWGEVFVDEPVVPRITLGQPATLYTDAGGSGIEGKVTYISPRAEFTPRNVQTAEERSKLVYRIKVSADNRNGVLKPGMPVEAELPLK
jgi:HlyD family secretion protein